MSRTRATDVGHDTFNGVCAKCHGMNGQGLIGPPIAQSPLLADRNALTLPLFREGPQRDAGRRQRLELTSS